MSSAALRDHPLRYRLANELHARPFPLVPAPARVAFVALMPAAEGTARDTAAERAHLLALLDRHGAPHPPPGANHWSGPLGRHWLKWESHTEFVTYTLVLPGEGAHRFDPASFAFPDDWLAEAPGARITSALVEVMVENAPERIEAAVESWFVGESVAVASVADASAVVASDFRIDPAGHVRVAIFAGADASPRRIGRITQRMLEIEVYKTAAMLGFLAVRAIIPDLSRQEADLARLAVEMADEARRPRHEEILGALIELSADLEALAARLSWRFGATEAYSALVRQRIDLLRERRFLGRPSLSDFMVRRFEPAMRTVSAMRARLVELTERAQRAANLLRTRVDVERSAQNQKLLASMDRRHALQLRLQRTVEGLSVVAISYYAVSLAGYMLYPIAAGAGISKGWLQALATLPIIAVAWVLVHRIRKGIEREP